MTRHHPSSEGGSCSPLLGDRSVSALRPDGSSLPLSLSLSLSLSKCYRREKKREEEDRMRVGPSLKLPLHGNEFNSLGRFEAESTPRKLWTAANKRRQRKENRKSEQGNKWKKKDRSIHCSMSMLFLLVPSSWWTSAKAIPIDFPRFFTANCSWIQLFRCCHSYGPPFMVRFITSTI